jgi:hypothetical protein
MAKFDLQRLVESLPTVVSRTLLFAAALVAAPPAVPAAAAVIGVDAKHTFSGDSFATDPDFSQFRAQLTDAGHTLVAMEEFTAAKLGQVDMLFAGMPNFIAYTSAEIAAIQSFTRRAVFASDTSLFTNGSDRSIGFDDNSRLLTNIVAFLSAGRGVAFLADGGTGDNPENFNALVAPFGIAYSTRAVDGGGRTVTEFAAHPVTAGLASVGVDFHLPMFVRSPSIDLTVGDGADNILAAYVAPEPGTIRLAVMAGLAIEMSARRRTCRKCRRSAGDPT